MLLLFFMLLTVAVAVCYYFFPKEIAKDGAAGASFFLKDHLL
jgi:hypothetical protein